MQLFAVLGNHPRLSLLEWKAIYANEPSISSETVAIFDDVEIPPAKIQDRLAGIQKVGTIIGSLIRENQKELVEFLSQTLLAEEKEGRFIFGISIYDLGDKSATDYWRNKSEALGLEVKKYLKAAGFGARLVTSKEKTLSSAAVEKNQLLTKGAEFVLLVTKDKLFIGKTDTVQNFEAWSHRDFDRPARNAKQGMLPPKLARMMVNLAGDISDKVIFDPFCGSSTVLMEAGLIGCKKMIGSDINPQAIKDSEENLAWIGEQKELSPYSLFVSAAKNIEAHIEKESVDIVVTEPFLGRPRTGYEVEETLQATIRDLNSIYRESFPAIKQILKPGGILVVTFPVHCIGKKRFETKGLEIMKELGFDLGDFPENILYQRDDQFVGRHILRFTKS
ncbi:MAG: methyltransferase domain-containing protein [Patescibacteria group bacterium]|jgi:tRNA G10  N-methylase Trm11